MNSTSPDEFNPDGVDGLPVVTVVGLGPGGPGLATVATIDAISATKKRYLRTARHPSASLVEAAETFDTVYESAETIESVYPAIVERLVTAAQTHGDVLYAVPGSPVVAEHTVELLVADPRIETRLVPALSFADLSWIRLGVDPLAEGVRIVDGHRFEIDAAGERGPMLVAQCDTPDILSRIKLAIAGDDGPDDADEDLLVTVLHHLGLEDERITEIPWVELDRQESDHLTSLWIPRLEAPIAGEVQRFVELVSTLRRECPWDAKQTHGTLRPHLLEETYEVLEALDAVEAATTDDEHDDAYELLEEELGDLLFQVVFHSVLGTEAGRFTMADVASGIHDKLRSRHPHVFSDVSVADADEVVTNWEAIKAEEKQRDSVLDGIPPGMPSLAMAQKVIHRADRLGLGPEGSAASTTVPTATVDEFGDWLLSVVALVERTEASDGSEGINVEEALRLAVARADKAIRDVESAGVESGVE